MIFWRESFEGIDTESSGEETFFSGGGNNFIHQWQYNIYHLMNIYVTTELKASISFPIRMNLDIGYIIFQIREHPSSMISLPPYQWIDALDSIMLYFYHFDII